MTEWKYGTHLELVDAGYLYRGESVCHYCGVRVYCYKTPNERLMLFDILGRKLLPHYASCRARRRKILEFPTQCKLRLEE
jgi:hypothetical protein